MKKCLFLLLMLMSVNLAQAIEVTATPVVNVEVTDDAYIITAIGDGEVVLYVNDEDVENPYTIARPEAGEEYIVVYVYATAQEAGKEMSLSDVERIEVQPKLNGEFPPDLHERGFWLITKDRYGHEIWHEMILDNGDYTTTIRLYYSIYGGFNPEIDERPEIPLYIVIDGVRYGAPSPNRPPVLGNAMDNPLNECDNCYVIETGYRYIIGVTLILENEVINPYLFAIKLPWSIQEDPTDYIKGDVDTNSIVSIADVITMIDSLISGNTSILNMENADCDGDGRLTITDVTLVIDYLLTHRW